MHEGYVSTDDGAELYFRQVGSGTPTLLVPDAAFLFEHFGPLTHDRSVIFYDVRNRGRSQAIHDRERLVGGIHQDAADLEAVRRHFDLQTLQIIGHSYWAVVALLHALEHGYAQRIVQIGPPPPDATRIYSDELRWHDQVALDFAGSLASFQVQRHLRPAAELRAELMAGLRRLMVLNSTDVPKLRWNVAELPNEAGAFLHINQNITPTLQALRLGREQLRSVTAAVLVIHGSKDRQAPYGGGRDWAAWLPDARLLTVEEAAHVPWIEAPALVFAAIDTFLRGSWPQEAVLVT